MKETPSLWALGKRKSLLAVVSDMHSSVCNCAFAWSYPWCCHRLIITDYMYESLEDREAGRSTILPDYAKRHSGCYIIDSIRSDDYVMLLLSHIQ